ncbi:MAG: peptide chain release factor 2 [Fibromonadaceae bacterium]|nr:peptide chain release factor 2 [Fibromonadaceae bacterium]
MDVKEEELAVLEKQTGDPELWSDAAKAQELLKRAASIRNLISNWETVSKQCSDLTELYELSKEESDSELSASIEKDISALDAKISEMELRKMLKGPDDAAPTLFSINSGAGGTESQDWTQMLLRMYTMYFEKEGIPFKVLDIQEGDTAGIKGCTLELPETYSYGMLRSEIGVHRLVRISPFDSNARRHTSFAAVYMTPIYEDAEVEINPTDLRVDTYRSSGAGGQYVNKTDSAVRITHNPTNIVVSCQTERSQIQNRETAMKMLRALLVQHYKEEEEAKRNERAAEKRKIEWGSQIRSYVLDDRRVKDTRTGYETSNTEAVLNGDIKAFVKAYLLAE